MEWYQKLQSKGTAMSNVTAIIADDEPLLRFHLKKELAEVWPDLDIVGEAKNGEEAFELIAQHKPDIAFLDIQMPGLTGLEVASKNLTATNIVFITAYDEYAINAFEHGAVDYLLKPVSTDRLEKTIDRLQKRICSQESICSQEQMPDIEKVLGMLQQIKPAAKDYLKWVKALKNEEVFIIQIEDVIAFHAEDKYTTVITQDNNYLIRTSVKELESQLDPDQFWRVHRATIINVSAIKSVKKNIQGKYYIEFSNSDFTPTVSRTFADKFKQM